MLDSFRRSIGVQMARFRFRKTHDKVISFTHLLPSSGTILVVLPFALEASSEHAGLLSLFHAHFSPESLTVLSNAPRGSIERIVPRSRVITIVPEDVTMFFLPRQIVLDRVHARHYDVAVDLNLDFMLPSAYICRESNARVRVGRSGRHADTFYNLQVRLDPSAQKGDAYRRLVQCLQMFFAEEGV